MCLPSISVVTCVDETLLIFLDFSSDIYVFFGLHGRSHVSSALSLKTKFCFYVFQICKNSFYSRELFNSLSYYVSCNIVFIAAFSLNVIFMLWTLTIPRSQNLLWDRIMYSAVANGWLIPPVLVLIGECGQLFIIMYVLQVYYLTTRMLSKAKELAQLYSFT